MSSVNKCILVGNLTRDPEVFGQATKATIACNENWKDKEGNKKEKCEFINVVFFGKLGEIAAKYLRKGSQVYVEGRIETQEYEKDGIKRYRTQVVVKDMTMLGGKKDGAERAPDVTSTGVATKDTREFKNFDGIGTADDIPF